MKIRLGQEQDIAKLLKLKIPCIQKMWAQGNNLQYFAEVEAYPNRQTFCQAIQKQELYVVEDAKNKIISFFKLVLNDKSYQKVFNVPQNLGIHAVFVAVEAQKQGVGTLILNFAKNFARNHQIVNLIVDTHELNLPMQTLAQKNNFKYVGDIYINANDKRRKSKLENKRLVYQYKLIKN